MKNNTLIFASKNQHKVSEVIAIVGDKFKVITLEEAGIHTDIPEPHDTIEANASEKSRTIFNLTKQNCFADDSGLEVNSLNGEPGVKSARYAGEEKSFDANVAKLLSKLEGVEDRDAQFKTVISLMWNGEEYLFEGITKGKITHYSKGHHGFGYDPVFIPEGSDKTFGEMEMHEKNLFNHRRKAVDKLTDFLKQL